ncbi:ABC transporter substrate-binding protein [bacterium]|nr:ABC transporter substrate-binding protein [bacterium]
MPKISRTKSRILLLTVTLLFLAASALAFYVPTGGKVVRMRMLRMTKGEVPQRIVSLAPVITETLYAIGAGDKVKGVTDYCDYPPEAAKVAKVGGYYDPNFEAILSLRPDLVILLPEHKEHRQRFQYLRIATYTVEMNSIAGIMSTFIQLGSICQKEAQGFYLTETFRQKIMAVQKKTQNLSRKKVVLAINRDYSEAVIREAYVAGQDGFYNELLQFAGGTNAYQKKVPKYPKLSIEGLIALHTDVLIELIPDSSQGSKSPAQLKQDWQAMPGLSEAQKKEVYILTGSYLVRPGPRVLQLLDDLVKILHPEIVGE